MCTALIDRFCNMALVCRSPWLGLTKININSKIEISWKLFFQKKVLCYDV
jgi:hypothetical protein